MKNYTIREISEMFELPSSTLRYYESEELLPEVPKSSSGNQKLDLIGRNLYDSLWNRYADEFLSG